MLAWADLVRGIRLDPEHSPNSLEAFYPLPFRHSLDKMKAQSALARSTFAYAPLCSRLSLRAPELPLLLLPRFRHSFQLRLQVVNLPFLVLYDCA